MSTVLKHNLESDELREKVPLGENFAWWVFRRKTAAANDCCIREKPEVKLRLVSGERFPGQYYDQETDLHYNYFRDYNPATGRYVESDPIGLKGGLNTYLYVNANSLVNIDAFGLLADDYYAAEQIIRDVAADGHFDVPASYGYGLDPISEYNGVKGSTEYPWNGGEISITDRYFERCINDKEAKDLLNIYIHETIHYNHTFFEFLMLRFFQDDDYRGTGSGIGDRIHDSVYAQADAYTEILFEKYNRLRREMVHKHKDSYDLSRCECDY